MAETDLADVKDRIIAILKKDTNLSGDKKDKLRDVRFGTPPGGKITGLSYPIAYVYDNDDLEDDKPFGAVVTNVLQVSERLVKFNILIIDSSSSSEQVERQINSLYKRTRDALKNNVSLLNPDGGGPSTALATWSLPKKGRSFQAQFRGKSIDARIIILHCNLHN